MAADAVAQLSLGVARKERTATRYSVAGHLTFPIHGIVAIFENNEDYKRELLNNLLSGNGPILWSKLATFYDGLGRGGNR